MHPVTKAEKILAGKWIKAPKWIFESPDSGKTVYRRLFRSSADIERLPRPHVFKQLYRAGGNVVDDIETLDAQYFDEVFKDG